MTNPPVALVAYSRPEHTARVLESLRSAGVATLYAFSDAPKTPDKREAVEAVRHLLDEIDWCDIRVTKRETNLGLARSITSAAAEVLSEHDVVIVLEDDCVALSGFLEFFRRSLEFYAKNERVWCVSGYTAPAIRVPRSYPYSAMSTHRYSTWGWATWRDRWAHYSNDLPRLKEQARARGVDLNVAGRDIGHYLDDPDVLAGRWDVWSLGWLLVHLLNDGRAILPTRSVVENIGFDDSGVHCNPGMAADYKPGSPSRDTSWLDAPFPETVDEVPAFVTRGLREQFDYVFEKRPFLSRLKRRLRRLAS
jgi:hypothetical protein